MADENVCSYKLKTFKDDQDVNSNTFFTEKRNNSVQIELSCEPSANIIVDREQERGKNSSKNKRLVRRSMSQIDASNDYSNKNENIIDKIDSYKRRETISNIHKANNAEEETIPAIINYEGNRPNLRRSLRLSLNQKEIKIKSVDPAIEQKRTEVTDGHCSKINSIVKETRPRRSSKIFKKEEFSRDVAGNNRAYVEIPSEKLDKITYRKSRRKSFSEINYEEKTPKPKKDRERRYSNKFETWNFREDTEEPTSNPKITRRKSESAIMNQQKSRQFRASNKKYEEENISVISEKFSTNRTDEYTENSCFTKILFHETTRWNGENDFTLMDLNDQMDSLHLTEPRQKRRRRLTVHKTPQYTDSDLISPVGPEYENVTLDDNNIVDCSVRRSSRKKSTPVRWNGQNISSNKNKDGLGHNNLEAIKNYYLDKTIKKATCLETIFEEDVNFRSKKCDIMSVRKLRRSITFCEKVHPSKIKKRRLKVSKMSATKRLSIKATLDDLYKKLAGIEQE